MNIPVVENVRSFVAMMDRIGFDVGSSRISIYTMFMTMLVVIAVIVFGRVASHIARRFFGHVSQLDPSQQVLGEKLVSIGVWMLAILIGIDVLGIDLTALTVFSGAAGLAHWQAASKGGATKPAPAWLPHKPSSTTEKAAAVLRAVWPTISCEYGNIFKCIGRRAGGFGIVE